VRNGSELRSFRRDSQRSFKCGLALIIPCVFLIAGCSKNSNTGNSSGSIGAGKSININSSNDSAKKSSEEIKKMADQQGQATAQDKGNFKIVYSDPQNEKYAQINARLKRSGALEQLVDELNAAVAMPEDVTVVFKQCGEADARWNPKDHSIYMCYELMEDVAQRLMPLSDSGQDMEEAVGGATMFVFFHEVGHCLFDLLKLPLNGRQEEAIDQLAAYVFVDCADDQIEKVALKGAYLWGHKYDELSQTGATEGGLNQPWADEHSFNAQRFYSIICWVYGHDPNKYQDIVNSLLPEARAALCPQEYARVSNAWATPLKPFLKDSGSTAAPTQTLNSPTGDSTVGGERSGH
jgi:hypothetical protein